VFLIFFSLSTQDADREARLSEAVTRTLVYSLSQNYLFSTSSRPATGDDDLDGILFEKEVIPKIPTSECY
jgi:hypothetical protein